MLDTELLLTSVYDTLDTKIEALRAAGVKGDKGDKGDKGIDGKDGKQGKDGKDGSSGKDGVDGRDGKDGEDGKDGVSITNVTIDFDGHLVVTLSDGNELDAGSVEELNKAQQTIYNISTRGPATEMSSNLDINNKGFTSRFQAAVPLLANQLCALNSDSKMAPTDADSETSTNTLVAIALGAVDADGTGVFLIKGFYNLSGFTPGAVLYISQTAGEITTTIPTTPGSFVRVVGYCTKATEIFFDPDKTWIEVN